MLPVAKGRPAAQLYLLQISILLQRRTFIADIPIVAAVAAEGFGLRADQACMHKLCKEMIGLAEVRQQLRISMLSGVLRNGTAHKVEAEALRAVLRVKLDLLAVHPFAARLMLLLHPDEVRIRLFKQAVRPFLPVSINELSEKFHPLD